jgi:hypothetical protein
MKSDLLSVRVRGRARLVMAYRRAAGREWTTTSTLPGEPWARRCARSGGFGPRRPGLAVGPRAWSARNWAARTFVG